MSGSRIIKTLLATLGALAILLAVALGLFRLAVAQIPEYQAEIKAWVAEELGLLVDFAALDARLGLAGPELTLHDATIGGSDGFLAAEQAAITLDPAALVLHRHVEFSRLTLAGVRLSIERDVDGSLHFGGLALGDAGSRLTEFIPQAAELVIRDARLQVADAASGRSWEFANLDLSIAGEGSRLTASASARPPESLAASFEMTVEAELGLDSDRNSRWLVSAQAGSVDVAELAALVSAHDFPPVQGRGDLSAEVEWLNGSITAARSRVELENLQPGTGREDPYQSLSMNLNWRLLPDSGWELVLDDVSIRRGGRDWPEGGTVRFALDRDEDGVRSVELAGDFFRLEDLEPAVMAFPDTQLAEQWALFEPDGEINELDFRFERRGASFAYELEAAFDRLAILQVGSNPGLDGLSGRVQASEDSGTAEFLSDEVQIQWPALFPEFVVAESLRGAIVWRQGRDVVQILSVDLGIGVFGEEAHASFDLRLPTDGGSATLEVDAELAEVPLQVVKDYLPTRVMPGPVVDWLERAVQGGRARDISLEFFGPLASFPFDGGDGLFRVGADIEGVSLDYMPEWPEARDLDGRIEFVNAGFAARGAGRVLDSRTDNLDVSIADLRRPLLTIGTDAAGPLDSVVEFARTVPLIVAYLGPGFERITINAGTALVGTRLDLPLYDPSGFQLETSLEIGNGDLSILGLEPGVSEINGLVTATEESVSATGIEALFAGGPVTVSLEPSDQPGYRAELTLAGETTVAAVAESFALPYADRLDGQTFWQGRLFLPSLDPLTTSSTRVTIDSNLTGIALRLPQPLAKAPGEPSNLSLDLQFRAGNRLELTGNLGATRRFAFSFAIGPGAVRLSSGAVQFGGDEPLLPVQPGILVAGRLEQVELDEWMALSASSGLGSDAPLFLGAELEIAELHAFGQQLGATSLRIERGTNDWLIDLDSEAVAGEIAVPRPRGRDRPVVADMSRIYLSIADGGLEGADPRSLPGLRFDAEEFGFGNRQLGSVSATVEPTARGLLLTSFTGRTESLETELSGSWLQGPLGARTTIDARIASSNVQTALRELGLDPAVEGESARIEAQVYWDSAPSGEWLDHLNGDASLLVETGTLREIDPGAGRVVGLMSIAALPRRLALDFRDVFQDGFAFDEISGSFRIIDGNAFTDNLKFSGPAAEIGVVGRTGLRDRDYRQQVVISAEPGKILPTVGGLLGGAGVGAALLIFTRLFKEPLKGIGQASYCLSGAWEAPTIAPLKNDEPAEAERCAELPDEMLPEAIDE